MNSSDYWDWDTSEKQISFQNWQEGFTWVEEPYASPDGENIAAVVRLEDESFGVCVNGKTWDETFEKVWHLRFSPDGRLTALVCRDMLWSVAVDGRMWSNQFDYAWQPMFSRDGGHLAMAYQQEMRYGLAKDDVPWDQNFVNLSGMTMASDGSHTAAVVQTRGLDEAAIFDFAKGAFTVSVDGEPWKTEFVNVWGPAFSQDGRHVAAQVRLNRRDYTIAVDGMRWDQSFGSVWEPVFNPMKPDEVTAPVKTANGWTLATAHKTIWQNRYGQCWHHQYSPDGKNIAAIVSPSFGKWSVAVNDQTWNLRAGDMVSDLTMSPGGNRVAVTAKDKGRWKLVVDDHTWQNAFERLWAPVFSPDEGHVAVKADLGDAYALVLDGRVWSQRFDQLWDPVFSPDGEKVLVRSIENGNYNRRIISVDQLLQ